MYSVCKPIRASLVNCIAIFQEWNLISSTLECVIYTTIEYDVEFDGNITADANSKEDEDEFELLAKR